MHAVASEFLENTLFKLWLPESPRVISMPTIYLVMEAYGMPYNLLRFH